MLIQPTDHESFEKINQRNTILTSTIFRKLRESHSQWDIVPSVISSVIWQTKEEIGRNWVEFCAPEEWRILSEHSIWDSFIQRLTEIQVKWLILEIALSVQSILLSKPNLRQRFGSRLWLMVRQISEVSREDQDRALSLHLGVPYAAWCSFFQIISNFWPVREFYQRDDVSLGYESWSLFLSRTIRKWWELVNLDPVPGGRFETIEADYLEYLDGVTKVEFGQGIKQRILFDAATLKHAERYISTREWESQAREIILEKHFVLVWKKLIWRGNKPDKEPTIIWELAWKK